MTVPVIQGSQSSPGSNGRAAPAPPPADLRAARPQRGVAETRLQPTRPGAEIGATHTPAQETRQKPEAAALALTPRPATNIAVRALNRTARLTMDAVMITVFSPVILVWWLGEKWPKRPPRS